MHKHEAKFCTALKHWLEYNMPYTCFIEAKISVGDNPFNLKSGFKPHQLPTLLKIKHGSLAYKISDADRTTKPFDIFFACHDMAYVAIHWVRKGNKRFYLIDPDVIQGLIDDGRKSIDEKIAMVVAEKWGELA